MVKEDRSYHPDEHLECDEHDPKCNEPHHGCTSRRCGFSAWPSRLASWNFSAAYTLYLSEVDGTYSSLSSLCNGEARSKSCYMKG
jgi:hypothetical protein